MNKETEQELKLLYERFALEKRKPSGYDTHAVRTRVKDKYHDIQLQNGLKSELWQLSERLLGLLRTPGLAPTPDSEATSKAIGAFLEKINSQYFPEIDPASPSYLGPTGYAEVKSPDVVGPNAYFIQTQPELVRNYGYPFFTTVPAVRSQGNVPGPIAETVFGVNTIFFGAFSGGDKRLGHDVVFYLPENHFYFWDPVLDCYVPTTESKVRLAATLAIQRVAQGLVVEQVSMILNKFLTESVLDQIMAKAKTLLAVEREFFEGSQAKARFIVEDQTANDIANKVREFIESSIAVDETAVLTVNECIGAFECYQHCHGSSVPSVKEIKLIVQAKVREIYGRGVRNDLVLADKKCVSGWRGLRLDHQTA